MAKTAFEQIRPALNRDEDLLWCGRPQRTILDRIGATFWIAVVMAALGCFLIALIKRANSVGVMIALIVLFIIVLGTGFLRRGFGAERTAYAVTNRRVIVDRHPRRSEFWSAPLDAIDELSFRAGSTGSGTIFCARTCLPWNRMTERRGTTTTALFRRISDVDAVYALLTEARNAYGVVTTTRWRAPGIIHRRYRG